MRPFLHELAQRKESLTMENVFAPQAQQLQTAISQERSIAAENIPSSIGSEFAFASSRNGQRNRETDKLTESHFLSRYQGHRAIAKRQDITRSSGKAC